MIGFEYGTTTVLLQWILVAYVSSRKVLVDGKGALSGTRAKASGIILAARALDSLKAALECDQQ